jgi:hypothetical protein
MMAKRGRKAGSKVEVDYVPHYNIMTYKKAADLFDQGLDEVEVAIKLNISVAVTTAIKKVWDKWVEQKAKQSKIGPDGSLTTVIWFDAETGEPIKK